MSTEHLQEARDLLYLADLDLKVADRVLTTIDPLIAPSLFHAQQAAEKALKAYLAVGARDYPRTHDLVVLLDLCAEIDGTFEQFRSTAEKLRPYAIGPRYLRLDDSETLEEATLMVALARQVYQFVLERLPPVVP